MDQYSKISHEAELSGASLVLVSKTHSIESIKEFYDRGQRAFGENKVQELVPKYESLPKDIRWHFIGHLQKNKVKYIAPFVDLIHSVDDVELLEEINKRASQNNRKIKVLIEIRIASEETKHGIVGDDSDKLIAYCIDNQLDNVSICGLMGMATYTDDEEQIEKEFKFLKSEFDRLKSKYFSDQGQFKEISMGMSGDYTLALRHGSTLIRIGTLIFGKR